MQKILCLLSLVLSFYTRSYAQQFPYQFSYTNEPYATLTGGTELDQDSVWDEGVNVPFGFDFQFGGQLYNRMTLDGYNGGLFPEGALFGDTIDAIFGYAVYPGIYPKANTIVRYLNTGAAPNRIAKVEMFQVGFDGVAGEVSYQIWLYETSNTIQIRLGNQDIQDPAETFFNKKSPLIGFMLDYHSLNDFESVFPHAQFVVGTPASPMDSIIINGILDESSDDGPQYGLTGVPLNNSVFTFTPGVVSTNQAHLSSFRLSPNPAQDVVRLEGIEGNEAAQIQLLDEQGRVVASLEMPAGETILRLPEHLTPGLYLLRYTSRGQVGVSKLLKI